MDRICRFGNRHQTHQDDGRDASSFEFNALTIEATAFHALAAPDVSEEARTAEADLCLAALAEPLQFIT
jgi:hypothetical protein